MKATGYQSFVRFNLPFPESIPDFRKKRQPPERVKVQKQIVKKTKERAGPVQCRKKKKGFAKSPD
jgi:hypothetical protein